MHGDRDILGGSEVSVVEVVLAGEGKTALSRRLMEATLSAIEAARGEPLLLRGDGDAFSAGLHLAEVASLEPDAMRSFLDVLTELAGALFHYRGPTVAAVNGHAIAGGLIVALMCDRRIATASPKARIGLNEVALGLRFPPRLLEMVRYRIPAHHHETVMLQGPLVPPDMALQLGMVDALAEEPVSAGREALLQLSRLPARAYADVKLDLRGQVGRPSPDNERRFLDDVLPVWTGPELKARIAAFLNKR